MVASTTQTLYNPALLGRGMSKQLQSGSAPATPQEAVARLVAGEDEAFARYLSAIPPAQRQVVTSQLIQVAFETCSTWEATLHARKIMRNAHLRRFVPLSCVTVWEQALVFINTPFLKTRVGLSFFDHPKMLRKSIDYDYAIFGMDGALLTQDVGTIHAQQTKTFELPQLVDGGRQNSVGLFLLRTAEQDLGSLRAYAYWYNEHGITSTHEKGAYRNGQRILVYPTIVCDPTHETFLAIGNKSEEPLNITCTLVNQENVLHPNKVQLRFGPRAAALLPLSSYFSGMREFLKSGPGAAYIGNSGPSGIYYYFIHNTERKTWQVQHL